MAREFLICVLVLAISAIPPRPTREISQREALALFHRLTAEIYRLESDGLIPRSNRPESFAGTLIRLEKELHAAQSPIDIGQVFRRLDAAYPNGHSGVYLPQDMKIHGRSTIRLPISFRPEFTDADVSGNRYFLTSVQTDPFKAFEKGTAPQVGDELLKINDVPLAAWVRENLIFCKWPLASQCTETLFDNLEAEVLGWNRRQTLVVTLKRGSTTWDVRLPVLSKPTSEVWGKAPMWDQSLCEYQDKRYPSFKRVYGGRYFCAYESAADPAITLLRIPTFSHKGTSHHITSGDLEVQHFIADYWSVRRDTTKTLIIDVTGNSGGHYPISLIRALAGRPFVDAHVQVKAIRELRDSATRVAIQTAPGYLEHLYDVVFRHALAPYATPIKAALGQSFLPPLAKTCNKPTINKECSPQVAPAGAIGYRGGIVIMTDMGCSSACSSFVQVMKRAFQGRIHVVGLPDHADTSRFRVAVDFYSDTTRTLFHSHWIEPEDPDHWKWAQADGALLRWVMPISVTVTPEGDILSGKPTMPDVAVPWLHTESYEQWVEKTVGVATQTFTRSPTPTPPLLTTPPASQTELAVR